MGTRAIEGNGVPRVKEGGWGFPLYGLGFADERQRSAGAGRDAQPATDAAISIQCDMIPLGSDGLHLTSIQTQPTALASCRLKLGDERAGDSLGGFGLSLEAFQNAAAAATATANGSDKPGISRIEDQIGVVSLRQDLHDLGLGN